MLFLSKEIPTALHPIILNGTNLNAVYFHTHLDLILTKKMTWSEHILSITNKAKKANPPFKRLQVFNEQIYIF